METKSKKKTSTGTFLVFIIIMGVLALFLYLGDQSKQKDQAILERQQQNTASLQTCIEHNVTPLQNLAAINPSATNADTQNARIALDACKAQYPTE